MQQNETDKKLRIENEETSLQKSASHRCQNFVKYFDKSLF